MTTRQLVSVVTAVRNANSFLEETILSVLGQSYSPIEFLIIDGGSTDGTLEIIKKYESRISFWVSEPDGGMYDAINKGLRRAKGSYLAYLNADDLYYPTTVATAVEFFNSHPDSAVLYGDCEFINGEGKNLYRYRYPEFNWKRFVSLNWMPIPQPTLFWRREVHDSCGYIDSSYKMAGDFEFLSRVGREFRISHLKQPMAKVRLHGGSLTARGAELNKVEMKRMKESLGIKDGLGQLLARYSAEVQIKSLNMGLMFSKLMSLVKR